MGKTFKDQFLPKKIKKVSSKKNYEKTKAVQLLERVIPSYENYGRYNEEKTRFIKKYSKKNNEE